MKRNLTKLAQELAGELLTKDRDDHTGATVIAYYEPRNGTPRRVVRVIDNAGDPYAALHTAGQQCPSDADAILLTCTGWAAPNDDNNTPPSQHPQRQRIALVVAQTLTRKKPARLSVVAFPGKQETETTGDGHGPLAEAITNTADAITARRRR